MSSRYVRQTVRGWLAGLVTPFHDTINLEQDPADPIWMTVEFDGGYATKESYCMDFSEDGTIRLVFFGTGGIGDDTLLAQAEADADTFFASIDPAGKLVLESISPPDSFGGRDVPWFGVEISISYTYRK